MIELRNVSLSYGKSEVLKNLNYTFNQKLTCIIGPNGSGKTTLLKLASAIIKPSKGEVLIDGINPWSSEDDVSLEVRRRVVYVHEKPTALRGTVWDNVAYGLKLRGLSRDEISSRVSEALEIMELKELAETTASELSAGQLQKVAIARAIAINPKYLLLDEPTAPLDYKSRRKLLQTIQQITRRGSSVIIATHTTGIARKLEAKILYIKDKTLRERHEPP